MFATNIEKVFQTELLLFGYLNFTYIKQYLDTQGVSNMMIKWT